MKLLTKAIEKQLEANPLYSHDEKPPHLVPVICKIFNPMGAGTWFITEASREGDDWRLFGLVNLHETELGYFMLSELQNIKIRGLGLERDRHYEKKTLADAMKEYNYSY